MNSASVYNTPRDYDDTGPSPGFYVGGGGGGANEAKGDPTTEMYFL